MVARRMVASALELAALVGPAAPAGAGGGEPRIWVRPSTGLVHDQVVEVRGEGFAGAAFVAVAQCDRRVESFNACDQSNVAVVEGGVDEFSVPFELVRAVSSPRYGVVDCASAVGACVVAAFVRPTRPLDVARLAFDPEGPPARPPLSIDLDIAHAARVRPDGRGALVDIEVTCRPGMHAVAFVEVAQEDGEEDVSGVGVVDVDPCHGTVPLQVEVRVAEGRFTPGHAVALGSAFGVRPGEDGGEVQDSELVRVSLQG